MLVVASWVIFWFDVTQLQPQISTALGILLSTVLFSFGTDFGMPRAPYLTGRPPGASHVSFWVLCDRVGGVASRRLQGQGARCGRAVSTQAAGVFSACCIVIALAVTHGTR